MTMVNPEFESILGNSNSTSENSTDKATSNTTDDRFPNQNMSPTPFEVVLLNDDLSDNSDDPAVIEKIENQSLENTRIAAASEKPQETNDSSSAKPFLRVRSIAELQSIKVHECKICNIRFNTPRDLELHSQQHTSQSLISELGRSTPMQKISPMVAKSNRKTISDLQTVLLNQTRQRMSSLLSPSGSQASPNSGTLSHQKILFLLCFFFKS